MSKNKNVTVLTIGEMNNCQGAPNALQHAIEHTIDMYPDLHIIFAIQCSSHLKLADPKISNSAISNNLAKQELLQSLRNHEIELHGTDSPEYAKSSNIMPILEFTTRINHQTMVLYDLLSRCRDNTLIIHLGFSTFCQPLAQAVLTTYCNQPIEGLMLHVADPISLVTAKAKGVECKNSHTQQHDALHALRTIHLTQNAEHDFYTPELFKAIQEAANLRIPQINNLNHDHDQSINIDYHSLQDIPLPVTSYAQRVTEVKVKAENKVDKSWCQKLFECVTCCARSR